jgi:cell division septation protein DedD
VQTYDASGNNPTPAATPEREAPPISRQGTYQAAALETINSGFGVQVASYREYANAERHLQELQTKGFSKVLIRLQGNVHQVVLGPFETREAAQVYKDNLRSNYQIRGFVTALE